MKYQTTDKEEMNHYMLCRLGDSCNRCKNFMGEIVGTTFANTVIDMNIEDIKE